MEIKFLRQVDELGRLVIPIDLRRQYEINPGDKIRIIPQDNGIFIQAEKCVQNEGERGNGDRKKHHKMKKTGGFQSYFSSNL